jgi:uncharacterized repeat protein (TIGR01451 family)
MLGFALLCGRRLSAEEDGFTFQCRAWLCLSRIGDRGASLRATPVRHGVRFYTSASCSALRIKDLQFKVEFLTLCQLQSLKMNFRYAVYLLLAFIGIWTRTLVHAQSVVWAEDITNGVGWAATNGMAIDANGNLLFTGFFGTDTDFDPGPGTYLLPTNPNGYYDIFVLKLDSNRNFLWAEGMGSSGLDAGRDIAVDALGNVYVVGNFQGVVDFDPGPAVYNLTAPAQSWIFIQKLSPSGNLLWAKAIPGNHTLEYASMAIGTNGNVLIAGQFRFSGDFDPGAGVVMLNAPGNIPNAFVLQLDSAGNFVWVKQIEGSGGSWIKMIALDAANNIYCGGELSGTNDFDPGIGTYNVTSAGLYDAFILKLNATGNFVWVKAIQGANNEVMNDIAVSAAGAVTFSGTTQGGTDFDPGPGTLPLPYVAAQDYFVERLDSAGNLVWAKTFGSVGDDFAFAIALDTLESVYVTGSFAELCDFDPSTNELQLSSGSTSNYFFQKLDPAGNLVFAKSIRSNGTCSGNTIMLDRYKDILIAGWMEQNVDVDPGPGNLQIPFLPFGMLLSKYRQDSCFTLALNMDSIRSITCQNPLGYAEVSVFGANGPATVTWNTTPPTTGLTANFVTSGIYTALVTDARGCAAEAGVVITAPQFPIGMDLETVIIPGSFMPGFTTSFQVNASNSGCTPATGQLKVTLDAMLVFTSAVPAPTSIVGDTLIWNFSSLAYGGPSFNPSVTVLTPVWAVSGDSICLTAKVLPLIGDLDTANNHTSVCTLVTSSYDPNDKRVDPPGQCYQHFVFRGQPLRYTVRFQNTGTAPATTVRVLDGLDYNVDPTTFQIVAQSHPMVTQLLPGNILEFTFDNIQLPDSNANEPASHGYLVYEILPTAGVQAGTEIRNRASIYFDFNAPIFTDQTFSTIVDTMPVFAYRDTMMVCQGGSFTFQDGFTVTNVSNDLSHVSPISSVDGCLSVLVTQLYMMPVDTAVAATATTLTALGFAFNYRWLDCNNNYTAIPGANGASFTPTLTGSYAVEISSGCVDTSSCYPMIYVSADDALAMAYLQVLPNPTIGRVQLRSNQPLHAVVVTNLLGVAVLQQDAAEAVVLDLDLSYLAKGIYFLKAGSGLPMQRVAIE